jgi:predicted MFS family arabinose efflux permease
MAMGAGGLCGSAIANVLTRRWPLGRVYVLARLTAVPGALLLPLAGNVTVHAVAVCAMSFFVVNAAIANTNVINVSLRQALTPERLRGRMTASARTLVFGALPLGGLAAAALTSTIGLEATLWVGAVGYSSSIVPILASPIPRLRSLPQEPLS